MTNSNIIRHNFRQPTQSEEANLRLMYQLNRYSHLNEPKPDKVMLKALGALAAVLGVATFTVILVIFMGALS